MPASLMAASAPSPIAVPASTSSTLMSRHTWPWESPSKVTVPIITQTKNTVPGSASSDGSPPSGGRQPTTPSRASNGLMRANRPK